MTKISNKAEILSAALDSLLKGEATSLPADDAETRELLQVARVQLHISRLRAQAAEEHREQVWQRILARLSER